MLCGAYVGVSLVLEDAADDLAIERSVRGRERTFAETGSLVAVNERFACPCPQRIPSDLPCRFPPLFSTPQKSSAQTPRYTPPPCKTRSTGGHPCRFDRTLGGQLSRQLKIHQQSRCRTTSPSVLRASDICTHSTAKLDWPPHYLVPGIPSNIVTPASTKFAESTPRKPKSASKAKPRHESPTVSQTNHRSQLPLSHQPPPWRY